MNQPTSPLVVSWGGGVNSTALVVGLYQREIVPDLILFADTGGEKPETYAFLDAFQDWLSCHRFPAVTLVRKTSVYQSLEDNCLQKNMLPSLAYGFRSCSDKWKRQPQDKFANHWPPAIACWSIGQRVTKAIGYDAGERRRARIPEDRQYVYWYPLIEWGWYREECLEVLHQVGLPIPIKSACFFCPASKKAEVLWLSRTHPELFQRALEMEHRAIPNLITVKGLGRHWSWNQLVSCGDPEALSRLPETTELPCQCFDESDEG